MSDKSASATTDTSPWKSNLYTSHGEIKEDRAPKALIIRGLTKGKYVLAFGQGKGRRNCLGKKGSGPAVVRAPQREGGI